MCLQRITTCSECKKDTDGLMTCTYADGEEIRLCPDCLKADGGFCLSCGCYASGSEGFDIVHPGYCNSCMDEFEQDDFWGDEDTNYWDDDEEDYDPFPDDDSEDEFRDGSLDY
jgi:hypothetical protein